MAFIKTIPVDEASGEVRELYLRQQRSFGFLPNYAKVFCYRPQLMSAWSNLQHSIKATMDARSYELITVAAALAIDNSYCALAHCKKLLGKFYSGEEVLQILTNDPDSPLSEAEKAMMELAGKTAKNSSLVTRRDIQRLKALGYTDVAIFDIVSAAAARCFFGKVPDALGVEADAPFGELAEALREKLVVGRPISAASPEVID